MEARGAAAWIVVATILLAGTTFAAGGGPPPEGPHVVDPEGDAKEHRAEAAAWKALSLCAFFTPAREACTTTASGAATQAWPAFAPHLRDAALPGPKGLDATAVWFAETPESLLVTLEIASLDARFTGVVAADDTRWAGYQVAWSPPGGPTARCIEGVSLAVDSAGGTPRVEATFRRYYDACPPDEASFRDHVCNTWWSCWWRIPVEFTFGTPATIRFEVPRLLLTDGAAGATLRDTRLMTSAGDGPPAPKTNYGLFVPHAEATGYWEADVRHAIDFSAPGRAFTLTTPAAVVPAAEGLRAEWTAPAGNVHGGRADIDLVGAAYEETPTHVVVELSLAAVDISDTAPGIYFSWAVPSGQVYDVMARRGQDGWSAWALYSPGDPWYTRVLELPLDLEVVAGAPGKLRFHFHRADLAPVVAGGLFSSLDVAIWDDAEGVLLRPPANPALTGYVSPPSAATEVAPSDFLAAPVHAARITTAAELFESRVLFLDDVGDTEVPPAAAATGANAGQFDITYLGARLSQPGLLELMMGVRDLSTLNVPPLYDALYYAFGAKTDLGPMMVGYYKPKNDPVGTFFCAPDVTVLSDPPQDPTGATWTEIDGRVSVANDKGDRRSGTVTFLVPVECVGGDDPRAVRLDGLEAATFLVQNPTGANGGGAVQRLDAAATDGSVVLRLASVATPDLDHAWYEAPFGTAHFWDFLALGLVVAALAGTGAHKVVRRGRDRRLLAAAKAREDRDVYRATLARAIAAGATEPAKDLVLAALRRRLGISEREHGLYESAARAGLGVGAGRLVEGATFLERYRVERRLGEGGFARTFLARDEMLGRLVVLKAARWDEPADAKRALHEARLLARMHHPHIVAIHDVEEVGGEVVIILEYAERGSLADRLLAGRLEPGQALLLADDVLAALEAAHAQGIVHRDVKAANVLLTTGGRGKLADFGIACDRGALHTAANGSFLADGAGTLATMSPEQARGLPATAASDVYAVGALLYETLAGRPYLPFDRLTPFDARLAIVEDPPDLPVPDVPGAVNALLAAALAKEPAGRPRDAATMRRLLAAARDVPALAPLT